MVQQLDPPGVAARDLAEALMIQTEYLGIDEPLARARSSTSISMMWQPTTSARYRGRCASTRTRSVSVVEQLRSLNPRPAGAYSPGPAPGYIVPDVTVRRFDDEWLIISNNESIPTLQGEPALSEHAAIGCRHRR